MDDIQNQDIITANGEYQFEPVAPGREVIIEWDITAGTADVIPGYVSLTGLFKPAKDITGTEPSFGPEGGTLRMDIPNSGRAALKVENASVTASGPPATTALAMTVCATVINRSF